MADEAKVFDDGLLDPEPDWVVGYEHVGGKLRAMDAERNRAFIQEGLDDIAAGRVVPHDVVKAEIAKMRAELGRA